MGDLNGLLKALREEVGVAGRKGATVKEILKATEVFYERKAKANHDCAAKTTAQNVDRPFLARVWSWLVADHRIQVGPDGEGNSLSLDEVEERYTQKQALRLFTTEQQIWITLTGHEKDIRKIPPKSFELLEVIAASRGRGITQPELVRITGQDKRSVPQRTQKLAEAGHVKKIPVLANHSNTSLLIHTKFVEDFASPAAGQQIAKSSNIENAADTVFLGHNKFVKAEKEIRDGIDALEEEHGLLLWDDLKKKTKVSDPVISRLMAEAMRRLEERGVVARVRASASVESYNANNALHRCVQLLRSPTEEDWMILFGMTKHEQSRVAVKPAKIQPNTEDSVGEVNSTRESPDVTTDMVNEPENLIEQHIPTWSPDRLLTHTVRSALLSVGTTGLSTKDLKKMVTGPFYVRPVDRFLDRCVWRWQKSQPSHLQHLAIVRDSAQIGKTSFYVHFVYDAFGVKVENGETFWEAVQSYPELNEPVLCDEYGFGMMPVSMFAGDKNDMNLRQALHAAGGPSYVLRFDDDVPRAKPRVNEAGQGRTKYGSRRTSTLTRQGDYQQTPVRYVAIGRPRKYPGADVPLDTTGMTPEQIKKALLSQKRAQEYLRKKARKEVEELVAKGVARDEAERTVLSEVGLSPEAYARNTIPSPGKPNPKPKPNGQSKKRKRGEDPQISYYPSTFAHTFPLYQNTTSEIVEPQPKRRRQTTKQKPKQKVESLGYFPSVLAHTQVAVVNSTVSILSTPRHKQDDLRTSTSNKSHSNLTNETTTGLLSTPSPGSRKVNEATASHSELSRNDSSTHFSTNEMLTLPETSVGLEASPAKRKASEMTSPSSPSLTHKRLDTGQTHQPKPARTEAIEPSNSTQNADKGVVATNKEKFVTTNGLDPSEQRKRKPTAPRMTPFGGTIAAMRKLIILGIVRNCGGVFPGDGELVYPFLTAYAKKFPEARPDNKTIKVAKTTLIGEGALKQIFFTCKSPSGLVQSRSIIALPGVPDGDLRVKALQKSMAECSPHPFFPFGTNIRPDLVPKAAAYNATGATIPRKAGYSTDLPVISNRVTPHYPWRSVTQRLGKTLMSGEDPDGSEVPTRTHTQTRKRKSDANTVSAVEDDLSEEAQHQEETFSDENLTEPTSAAPRHKRRKQSFRPHSSAEEIHSRTRVNANAVGTVSSESPASTRRSITKIKERSAGATAQPEDIEDGQGPNTVINSVNRKGKDSRSPNKKFNSQKTRKSKELSVDAGLTPPSSQARLQDHPFQRVQNTTSETTPGSSLVATAATATGQHSTPWELFSSITDDIARWETNQPEAFRENSQDPFVHYPFTKDHHETAPVQTNPVGRRRVIKAVTPDSSSPAAVPKRKRGRVTKTALEDSNERESLENQPTQKQNQKPKKQRQQRNQETDLQDEPTEPIQVAQRRSGTNKPGKSKSDVATRTKQQPPRLSALEVLAQKGEKTPGVRYSKGKGNNPKSAEPRRARYQWDADDDKKLLIATLLGHIVLGGLREENHWGIVSRMLDHKYDRELCRRRWATVRTKHRSDIEVIMSDLRAALLNSYEKGDAPTLDFGDLWENDWIEILTWAMGKIENPDIIDIELPETREAFEAAFLVQEFPIHEPPDFLENKKVATLPLRHSVLNAGCRVLLNQITKTEAVPEVATTHVRANVFTPLDTYNAQQSREKLQRFPEASIEQAIKDLLSDRIISQANKGRLLPNRTYDVSGFFLKAMQWKLSVPHFKYATAFKKILDQKFRKDGKIEYKSAFNNGDMITLINLLADGMLELESKGIPNKVFGLTTEGYKTRSMDKKVFSFSVFAVPSKTYRPGIPNLPLPKAPRAGHEDSVHDNRPLPLWIDINGEILPIMWDLSLAAVTTILVVDTATDAKHIAEKLQPCISEFEIQLIMQWLVDAGAAKWKDERRDILSLGTYWWSIITTPIAKSGSKEEAVMIAGVPLQ